MLETTLRDLNFTEKEIATYLGLLELGEARAGEIAKKADLNRTTMYDMLSSLMKKGLISKNIRGNQTYFEALEPKRLLSYIDREIENTTERLTKKKAEVEKLLPELISKQYKDSTRPKVQFYEDEKGMREAYEDTLTSKDPILAYANVETMHEALPNFFPKYYQRRSDAGVFIRAILPRNKSSYERAQKDSNEMRNTRFLPQSDSFTPEVNIYNNKILIASWKEKMAVIIESKELADFHRTIFERLWGELPTK